ncbi:MAG: hypothetical protein ACR2KK_23560 [Acidimicrobiales bacterium]
MAQQAIVRPGTAPAVRPRKATIAMSAAPAAAGGTRATTAADAAKASKAAAGRETRRVKATAATQAKQVKGTAVGQTKVVARTANQDVRELADTVRSQADQVKGEVTGQVREMLAETQGQLQQQADMQAGRLASVLWQVGTQAVALSEGRPEQAGPLVDYAEQAAEWLDNCASHIEERGLEGLATDVVDFARRRPGVFLAGAAVVGFGLGRLIRSGAVSSNGDSDGMGELEA